MSSVGIGQELMLPPPAQFDYSVIPARGAQPAPDLEARVKTLESLVEEQAERNKKLEELLKQEQESKPVDKPEKSVAEDKKDADKEKDKAKDDAKDNKPKVEEYEVGSDNKMSGIWKNGIEFTSADKASKVHIGGRTQFDAVAFADSNAFLGTGANSVRDADAVDFRRARLRVDGVMYSTMEWCAEYDLVNSANSDPAVPATDTDGRVIHVPAPTDLWWSFNEVPVIGGLRIGNQKEPIGLEHMTSSRFLDFMERSYNQDLFTGAFNNGFSPGIAMSRTVLDDRASVNLGVYKNTSNVFEYGVGDGEYALTGRLTCLPYYDEASKGRALLHLGISGSIRDTDSTMRYRARGSLRNGPGALNPVLGDTGSFASSQQDLFGLEAAAVYGPWLFQSEYIGSTSKGPTGLVNSLPQGRYYAEGFYVEALVFLTGEHREYENRFGGGAFGRVVPNENAYFVKGLRRAIFTKGAWQVGIRYSRADLNDRGLEGGVLDDITLGLNWFLNPNTKIQWNYTATWRDARTAAGPFADDDIHGVGMRFAHDF